MKYKIRLDILETMLWFISQPQDKRKDFLKLFSMVDKWLNGVKK